MKPLDTSNWAVTMFSFTTELVVGEQTPIELMDRVLASGTTDQIELDAPQAFASYPRISDEEAQRVRDLADQRGARLSMLGIYNDPALHRDRMFTLDESERYVAAQIAAAAAMGFTATRIMFGIDPLLLERLAAHAEQHNMPVLQEVQGGARPEGLEFARQREAIARIGSDKLGFVFDLSACMKGLPVTYLEELRREGVPEGVVRYLANEWPEGHPDVVKAAVATLIADLPLSPSARLRIGMPFGRFGNTTIADWRDSLHEFSAIHLKYWDLEDEDGIVSGPIADVRREFGAIGYEGVVTSEWGGHEWLGGDAGIGLEMTVAHKALYERAT